MIAAQPWCSVPGCTNLDLTTDHVWPKHRGGTDDPYNLRVICRHHNSSKGKR